MKTRKTREQENDPLDFVEALAKKSGKSPFDMVNRSFAKTLNILKPRKTDCVGGQKSERQDRMKPGYQPKEGRGTPTPPPNQDSGGRRPLASPRVFCTARDGDYEGCRTMTPIDLSKIPSTCTFFIWSGAPQGIGCILMEIVRGKTIEAVAFAPDAQQAVDEAVRKFLS